MILPTRFMMLLALFNVSFTLIRRRRNLASFAKRSPIGLQWLKISC